MIIIMTCLIPSTVLAHDLKGSGFLAGLAHPVLGPDHLLAMICVGILSALMGGRAVYTVPATFVCLMILGGILGNYNIVLLKVEVGISISVLILGAAIAFDRKMPLLISILFIGFFGIYHGHAHGTEMPVMASPILYALGFVFSTTTLHLLGVFLGYMCTLKESYRLGMRFSGAVIAGIGIQLLIGA